MQFPMPGKVTRPGARPGTEEGAAGGGGAVPRAQKSPWPAGSPPLTLGLRLHPSQPAAGERGWPRARGELAERLRSWGPTGGRWRAGRRGLEKKTQGENLHSNSPCSGSQVPGRLRFTARLSPRKAKVARMHEGSPLPLANPTTRPPPALLGPEPKRGGELSPEEERSAPCRRGQTRAGSAAPPPAPRRPARAAGPLSPRIMHGPGAPSALPPQEDTINVRGGLGSRRAGRRWPMVTQPRAQGAGWRGRGKSARPAVWRGPGAPKGPGAALRGPGGTEAGRGRGTDLRGGPGAITKLPECPRH